MVDMLMKRKEPQTQEGEGSPANGQAAGASPAPADATEPAAGPAPAPVPAPAVYQAVEQQAFLPTRALSAAFRQRLVQRLHLISDEQLLQVRT
jgi:hypothetical protein